MANTTITLTDVTGNPIPLLAVDNGDGTYSLGISGPIASSALPAGASTSAKQDTEISGLASILAKLTSDPATQTTLAAVLAKLTSDPATQTTLADILAKITSDPATQTTLASLLLAVDGLESQTGIVTEAAPGTDTASSGLNGRLQRIAQNLTTLAGYVDGLEGQTGIVTETAPATDTASSGLNGRLQRIAQRITSFIALLPASLGQKAKASALAVTLSSDEDILSNLGALTETAPTTDTASSGANGRLQRIAQRLTTFIALFPSALDTWSLFKVNSGPASGAYTITVHDSTADPNGPFRSLWVGAAGNVSVFDSAGNSKVFVGVVAGTVLPIMCSRINSTNTTVSTPNTNILGLK